MQFLTPLYFSLAAFLVAVILFYLFRKQFDEKMISSTLLWHEVMREWQATKWWKRLQNHLLLYLQLIILLLLMLALTRPFIGWNELSGDSIIVVLDTSASMTTEEEDSNRFQLAKQEVEELIHVLKDQRMTLILAEQTPRIIFSNETNKRTMVRELQSVENSYQHENMNKSIQLANQLLAETTGEIHVFSDRLNEEQLEDVRLNHDLIVRNIGNSRNNLSLLTFGVVENNGSIHGILTVHNENEEEQLVRISIENNGESLMTLQEIVGPNKQVQIPVQDLPRRAYYKAVITSSDDYQADNSTIAFLADDTEPSFYLIGDVNPFITKALHYFSTNIVHMDNNTDGTNGENALYIVEDIPDEEWPTGPLLILNPTEEGPFQVEPKQILENPLTVNEEDPFMQFVDMNDVFVQSSFPFHAHNLDTIMSSGGIPIISKGYYEGNPIIFLGLDIADTDWPLHPSFPVFLYNSIQFLTEQQETLGFLIPNEAKEITFSSGVVNSTIMNENNEEIAHVNTDEAFFRAPSIPGLYQLVEETDHETIQRLFAVTMDHKEKYIAPNESFTLTMEKNTGGNKEHNPNEIWPWLVLLAFIILLLEWEVYRRGIAN